ncbi:MAG: sigma factor-like helix-turn-helix DNA-binding protein [Eubacteriales bacterium]|nr:sigma factor-like helix-turn-helix DNA-binding protein [Eubacteriales bacterium]
MSFNNGLERKRFEAKQKALRAEYEKLGMSEEKICALYALDLAEFNSNRKYITHTQSMNPADLEADEDTNAESGRNPLFEKFREALSVKDTEKLSKSRYGWIDEIDNPKLATAIKKLSDDHKELLTLLVFDGYSQTEIAKVRGVSQGSISQKISTIKKLLRNFNLTL